MGAFTWAFSYKNTNSNNVRNKNSNIATAHDLDVCLNLQQIQAETKAVQQYQREVNKRQNVGVIMQSILSGDAPSCSSKARRNKPINTGTPVFDSRSIPLVHPNVPLQDNGCDCGVFVCHYAYSLYIMRHLPFIHKKLQGQM